MRSDEQTMSSASPPPDVMTPQGQLASDTNSGMPAPYIVGIISGVCSLMLMTIMFLTWRYCKRRGRRFVWQKTFSIQKSPVTLYEKNVKISQSSPSLLDSSRSPEEEEGKVKKKGKFSFRQATMPTVPQRHMSFQRRLSSKLDLSNIEFTVHSVKHKEQPSLGRIKPELYKQASVESMKGEQLMCGKLFFSLRYEYDTESLIVRVIKAEELPAKDFSGTSDPYIKIYLLPDRKHKYQTKVHRKTLHPEFEEIFHINVPYKEVTDRILQFSVYDFDRFSRHDIIGAVILRDILCEGGLVQETFFVRDVFCSTQDMVDLGELMLSLCYLPTAGRLTITIVKARNLKAMDITGSSDPYVKVALMCQGKRIKKKKTTVKKSTLNPVYNEAIVFDVPQENVDDVYLVVKLIDYDRIGSNEVMGCLAVGPKYPGPGREHWYEMLESPRKPVAQWYPLQEHVPSSTTGTPNGKAQNQRQSTVDSSDGSVIMN